ncbi:glycosyltransferase family 4 protein [Spirulina subsalsa FACHB-351]|uniref:Glycosyltransferase family 4 protein n=1 Tax=Spirulina subsalsa FACHB-351 TaxID=234711 RepID=A0ABT3L735_9CYAN|nr:glycosyltransferase family 1 protein [Spirulina subsalsa]MCW6037310.1 glycosyltransferase family 4 protein [Spirulina subsalsa FACHB-351]
MANILIDATPITKSLSGVGIYIFNLIKQIKSLKNNHKSTIGIVYQPGLKEWIQKKVKLSPNIKNYHPQYHLDLPVRFSNLLLDYYPQFFPKYWEPILESPDIIHGTNYTVFPYKNCRKVMTIYDLTFLKYPDYIDSVVKQYGRRVQKCLQWTDLVLTISESSKRDIVEYLNFDPERVVVTPLASRYTEQTLETLPKPPVDLAYDFRKPYLLFVSTLEPRKNITTLIAAFNQLKEQYKIDHELVLIGQKGWRYEPIFKAIASSPYSHHIHHLNYLPDELVALFYSQAEAFIYPSHYEGFGLPVLEAMTLGAPVITSNTSSLPEVAGEAAMLIDPNEVEDLTQGILKVISDSQLRQDLIQKGKQQAKLFSWERTAQETLAAYRSIL